MTYFSIDYRSPPSGIGQIVKNDEVVENVQYESYGEANYPYQKTTVFQDYMETFEDYRPLFDHLRQSGVTEVYDNDLAYDYPSYADERGHFTLDNWIKVLEGLL